MSETDPQAEALALAETIVAPEPPPVDEAAMVWRVKKGGGDTMYGPVDDDTLKEWANSAQIAPEDQIDASDENWRPAPEIDFLEMMWLVKLNGGDSYGPTTVGTLREFINEGLVTEKTPAMHHKTHQSLPLAALFAAVDFEKKRAGRRGPNDVNKTTANIAIDMAKDQRIRQLEEDLKELRKDHDQLTHKYRQLSLQVQQNVSGGGSSGQDRPPPIPTVRKPRIVRSPTAVPPELPPSPERPTGE